MKTISVISAFVAMTCAIPAAAANLVVNGDFSSGLSGFTTTYDTASNPSQGTILITTDPGALCGCFPHIGDHTTSSGNMLLIDGASGNTGAFWSQTFDVVADSDYSFSVWATSLGYTGPAPQLRATANGSTLLATTVLPYSTGSTATTWIQYTGTFSSGAATSVTLNLFDDAQVYSYNDLAVDDISFDGPAPVSGVPEPSSWALMLAGIGLVGAAMRRRASGVQLSFS